MGAGKRLMRPSVKPMQGMVPKSPPKARAPATTPKGKSMEGATPKGMKPPAKQATHQRAEDESMDDWSDAADQGRQGVIKERAPIPKKGADPLAARAPAKPTGALKPVPHWKRKAESDEPLGDEDTADASGMATSKASSKAALIAAPKAALSDAPMATSKVASKA